jgi:hypothetical protein
MADPSLSHGAQATVPVRVLDGHYAGTAVATTLHVYSRAVNPLVGAWQGWTRHKPLGRQVAKNGRRHHPTYGVIASYASTPSWLLGERSRGRTRIWPLAATLR